MSYPGNATLGKETQQRLLKTFEQTLDLAERGSAQEALLGCDFILRMDPQFEPARVLFARLNEAAGAAVTLSDLRSLPVAVPAPPPAVTAAPTTASPRTSKDELSFADLEDYGATDLSARMQAPSSSASSRTAILAAASERRFGDVVSAAQADPGTVAADPELARLAQDAQTHLEAEPYVRKFLSAARAAALSGQVQDAEKALQKARALDESHPEIGEIAALLERGQENVPSLTFDEPLGELSLSASEQGPDWGKLPPLPDAPMSLHGLSAPATTDPAFVPSESDRRIAELIEEGESAFARGELQSAIDAWSRIFLIDIDNQDASRLIDQARGLKAEAERKVEEKFHEATEHLGAGRVEEARAALSKVLETQPNHQGARELLDQLSAPDANVREIRARATASTPAVAAAPLKEEILIPPEPGAAPAKAAQQKSGTIAPAANRRPLLLGGGVLAIVVVVGAVLWTQRARFFPNSQPTESAPTGLDPLARAQGLHDQGKTEVAINQLRRLPPEDPQYQQAQALIQEWEKMAAPAPAPGPPPEETQRRDALLAAARSANASGERIRARALYARAAAISPLPAEVNAERAAVDAALAPYQAAMVMFQQEDWEFALPALWRLREADPGNPDLTRLLVDAYYNLGVQALQRDAVGEAQTQFKEALALVPSELELKRLVHFTETYASRPRDLLYRTYVKYLSIREL